MLSGVVPIVAISGSLQAGSSNTALLRAVAIAAAAEGRDLEVWQHLGSLPHFRSDLEPDAAVASLQQEVSGADAVLIATPEYAGGMPGALKNALDWLVGSGGLYEQQVVVVSAAPAPGRGHNARRWVEEVARMQGAVMRDSFTVAFASTDRPEEIAAHGRETLHRVVAALAAPADAAR